MASQISTSYLRKSLTQAHQTFQCPVIISRKAEDDADEVIIQDMSRRYKMGSLVVLQLDMLGFLGFLSIVATSILWAEEFHFSTELIFGFTLVGVSLSLVLDYNSMIRAQDIVAMINSSSSLGEELKGKVRVQGVIGAVTEFYLVLQRVSYCRRLARPNPSTGPCGYCYQSSGTQEQRWRLYFRLFTTKTLCRSS